MTPWIPAIDSAHPLASQPERYVLKREGKATFLAIDPTNQNLLEVSEIAEAHRFLTQEAALRAASELNRPDRGPLPVAPVGEPS
ncbi:MAG: hypothetical protein VKP70_02800 [Cyanobacteriota bacterium]|nr:hypothetical protein [Cyanobacteriota bacterium]